MCIGTYYKYGHALLSGAQAKIAQYQDLVEGSASRDCTGSSNASGSNVRKGDTRKGICHSSFTPYDHMHYKA